MTRIALLTSQSVAGVGDLLVQPNRGSVYNVVGVIGSEESIAEQELIESAGVPVILRPFRRFHEERHLPLRNLHARSDYDAGVAETLHAIGAEWVIVAGYRHILTDPILAQFQQRIICLHDGDLTIRDEDGRRPYAGLHAVRDAILDGRNETRSTAYLATRDVGEGPLFLLGSPYPVAQLARDARSRGDLETLLSYADLHRRWMRRVAWGEMLTRIAEIVSAGTLQIVGDVVWIDGVPGPCRAGAAPGFCADREDEARGVPASCPFVSR
jgi:folate-dependent phosphoribosylglycinamide formyltransferase PurN